MNTTFGYFEKFHICNVLKQFHLILVGNLTITSMHDLKLFKGCVLIMSIRYVSYLGNYL